MAEGKELKKSIVENYPNNKCDIEEEDEIQNKLLENNHE